MSIYGTFMRTTVHQMMLQATFLPKHLLQASEASKKSGNYTLRFFLHAWTLLTPKLQSATGISCPATCPSLPFLQGTASCGNGLIATDKAGDYSPHSMEIVSSLAPLSLKDPWLFPRDTKPQTKLIRTTISQRIYHDVYIIIPEVTGGAPFYQLQ